MEEVSRDVRLLATAQLANAVGDGAFYVTASLAFAHVLSLSPLEIGAGLTLAWTLGALAAAPLGRLADGTGLRRMAVVLSLVTAVAVAAMTVPVPRWLFVVLLALYAVAQSGSGAVRQALLVSLVQPARRTAVRARIQAVVNAGVGAGAAVGGLALHVGSDASYRAVFVLDAASFLVAALLLGRLPDLRPGTVSARRAAARSVLRDRRYVVAAAANAVLYLYMPLLSIVLPLYVAAGTAAPTWTVAGLFVLNTLGVVTLQVRAARSVVDLRSAARAVRRGGWAFVAACALLAWASEPSTPYVAVIILATGALLQVLGEVLLASGSWEIGFALADPERPGQWQGFYGAGIPAARAVGPLLLTWLLLSWSGPGWFVLGVAFALAAGLLSLTAQVGPTALSQQGARRLTGDEVCP